MGNGPKPGDEARREDQRPMAVTPSPLEEHRFGQLRTGPLSTEEALEIFQEGLTLQLPKLTVQVRFAQSGYTSQESQSPLPETSLGVGVWMAKNSANAIASGKPNCLLTVVTTVSEIDRYDILLALDELWRITEESEDGKELKAMMEQPTKEDARIIFKDLVWEANAPLSRVISPVDLTLVHYDIPERISGFSEAIRNIILEELTPLAGKRLGQDTINQEGFYRNIEQKVLQACDLHLEDGRDAILISHGKQSSPVLASDLPRVFVGEIFKGFQGKRVLLERDPVP